MIYSYCDENGTHVRTVRIWCGRPCTTMCQTTVMFGGICPVSCSTVYAMIVATESVYV